mmetsp:Transcript_11597/g.17560  ORF Transcript_11597/g.17560 Transcript_11597/m.17560 type:complete len:169 (-) Transcript_11597:690-1196(-)
MNSGSRTQRDNKAEELPPKKLLEVGDGRLQLATVSMFDESEPWSRTKDTLSQSMRMTDFNNELLKKTSVMKKLNKPEIILNSHTHYPQNMNRYLDHNPFLKADSHCDDLSQYLSQTLDQPASAQPPMPAALKTVTYMKPKEDMPVSKTVMGTRLPLQATQPSSAQSSM